MVADAFLQIRYELSNYHRNDCTQKVLEYLYQCMMMSLLMHLARKKTMYLNHSERSNPFHLGELLTFDLNMKYRIMLYGN